MRVPPTFLDKPKLRRRCRRALQSFLGTCSTAGVPPAHSTLNTHNLWNCGKRVIQQIQICVCSSIAPIPPPHIFPSKAEQDFTLQCIFVGVGTGHPSQVLPNAHITSGKSNRPGQFEAIDAQSRYPPLLRILSTNCARAVVSECHMFAKLHKLHVCSFTHRGRVESDLKTIKEHFCT